MDIPKLDDALEGIWQETLGLDDFDAGRLEAAITRNQQPAYGLTLVVHPLTRRPLEAIAELRPAWEQALPCSFFPEEILHFTIYSLRRSCLEPFSLVELEKLWNRLASELRPILEATPPFAISLRGLAVTADGAILIGLDDSDDSPVLRRLRRAVKAIPGVSQPRLYPPHVTVGQVLAPCGSTEGFRQAMDYLRAWQDASMGELSVPAVKLIYYSNRLLATVERWKKFDLRRTGHKSY
jgi:2'-5' RNA ligase